jgi:hypothetical protein
LIQLRQPRLCWTHPPPHHSSPKNVGRPTDPAIRAYGPSQQSLLRSQKRNKFAHKSLFRRGKRMPGGQASVFSRQMSKNGRCASRVCRPALVVACIWPLSIAITRRHHPSASAGGVRPHLWLARSGSTDSYAFGPPSRPRSKVRSAGDDRRNGQPRSCTQQPRLSAPWNTEPDAKACNQFGKCRRMASPRWRFVCLARTHRPHALAPVRCCEAIARCEIARNIRLPLLVTSWVL